jgi:hypothetical protein
MQMNVGICPVYGTTSFARVEIVEDSREDIVEKGWTVIIQHEKLERICGCGVMLDFDV